MSDHGAFVITGGSRGLGAALAEKAYSLGFPVALIARGKADLEKTKDEILKKFGSKTMLSIHAVDLTDEKKTAKTFDEIRSIHQSLRVLVNNAGTWTGGKSIQELTHEDVQDSLDLNFFAAFNATKALLANHKSGDSLSIINIGATASLRGAARTSAFAVAKSALRAFSQSLARELGPEGVHVAHFVIDGMIDNPRTRKLNARRPDNRYLSMESLSKEILHVAFQEPDCWTFEWDARTHNAEW